MTFGCNLLHVLGVEMKGENYKHLNKKRKNVTVRALLISLPSNPRHSPLDPKASSLTPFHPQMPSLALMDQLILLPPVSDNVGGLIESCSNFFKREDLEQSHCAPLHNHKCNPLPRVGHLAPYLSLV